MNNHFDIYVISVYFIFFVVAIAGVVYEIKPFKAFYYHTTSFLMKISFVLYMLVYFWFLFYFMFSVSSLTGFVPYYEMASVNMLLLNVVLFFIATLLPLVGILLRKKINIEDKKNYYITFTVINIASLLMLMYILFSGPFGTSRI